MRPAIGDWRSRALLRRPWVITALLIVFQAALLVMDGLGDLIVVEGLMIGAPALAAIFLRPKRVLVVAVVAVVSVLLAQQWNGDWGSADAAADISGAGLIGAAAVLGSAVRVRRDDRLAQARWVAGAAQRVLLRPLPPRLGRLAISSLYLAADEEASVGGDLYAAALVDDVPRVMVGDTQGKGMAATELVNYLFCSFRRAARERVPLEALPAFLDGCLHEELADAAEWEARTSRDTPAAQRLLEGFATAVVVDIADDRIHVANCGHPSPLLLNEGKVRELGPRAAAPPLGLGGFGGEPPHVDRFDFAPGDTLLLYTDGVTEARDRSGDFYPFSDRLADWAARTPRDLLAAIRTDLRHHAGARLTDDVVIVAIRRAT
jgi:hypothetical protein